ncbi:MAG: hypothetical protein RMA76_38240 [Deltaproteobacteria bacterium]|jgi:hypothetical protein
MNAPAFSVALLEEQEHGAQFGVVVEIYAAWVTGRIDLPPDLERPLQAWARLHEQVKAATAAAIPELAPADPLRTPRAAPASTGPLAHLETE